VKLPRTAVASLTLSAAALVSYVVTEGYTDKAVVPTKGDVPTIGFGSTTRADGTPVQMGDKTEPVAAIKRTFAYIENGETKFKSCVHVALYQAEYDLYNYLLYNLGPQRFCTSTIVLRLNEERYVEACEAILLFKLAAGYDCSTPGNRRCYGLWLSRLKSHKACMEAQQ